MKPLRINVFLCCDKNQLTICRKICRKKQSSIFCLFEDGVILLRAIVLQTDSPTERTDNPTFRVDSPTKPILAVFSPTGTKIVQQDFRHDTKDY